MKFYVIKNVTDDKFLASEYCEEDYTFPSSFDDRWSDLRSCIGTGTNCKLTIFESQEDADKYITILKRIHKHRDLQSIPIDSL
jgi:sulfite reductase beta subunit-like hemoprotein